MSFRKSGDDFFVERRGRERERDGLFVAVVKIVFIIVVPTGVRVSRRYFTISSLKRIDIFLHKKKRRRTRQQHRREMRASSDSWRGASTDRQRRSSVDATSRGTQKVQKHQCLFAACVPAKECGPEEVKCVPHSSSN